MVQPSLPRLEDFQLTAESLFLVPARFFEPGNVRFAIHIILVGAVAIAGHLADGGWPWILASFLCWFFFVGIPTFGIVSAAVIFPLLNIAETWFRNRTCPDFEKAVAFAKIRKKYLAEKAAYDQWVY